MTRHWTFGRKLGGGFAIMVALAIVVGVLSTYTLQTVVDSKDQVIAENLPLRLAAGRIDVARGDKANAFRGYLLTNADRYLTDLNAARDRIAAIIADLKGKVSADGLQRVDAIERAEAAHQHGVEEVLAMRKAGAPQDAVAKAFDERMDQLRQTLDAATDAFVAFQEQRMDAARKASNQDAATASRVITAMVVAIALLAIAIAWVLTTTLGRQIGSAVGQIQSSSSELQAAANQQATGAKEQAAAMTEISTTISELLATSRQIAESAQRVAGVADQTRGAAASGDGAVQSACETMSGIRRQIDQVVGHMLDLGRKSQQIGGVLDIVSELAEQTNILAINATIEAVGAGESGRRFAVVADEIRKLADRVAGSAKEVRTLIEDVRGAVNTTVMATETGSKAVDAGSRQIAEVAATFKGIADLVGTTTEAAREIELSTKQQATAVEQVNVAVSNVAQATRETEASSGQTQQTAGQLAHLSTDLLRMITPRVGA